jgi:hypothetical protein
MMPTSGPKGLVLCWIYVRAEARTYPSYLQPVEPSIPQPGMMPTSGPKGLVLCWIYVRAEARTYPSYLRA